MYTFEEEDRNEVQKIFDEPVKFKNNKYLCLECFEVFDTHNEKCCVDLIPITYKTYKALPKHKNNFSKMKKFVKLYLTGKEVGYNRDYLSKKQIKQIIEIRERFNLDISEQKQMYYNSEESYRDKFDFFNIKQYPHLKLYIDKFKEEKLYTLTTYFESFKNQCAIENLQCNKKYYIVPIFAYLGAFDNIPYFKRLYLFPSSASKYNIYDCVRINFT